MLHSKGFKGQLSGVKLMFFHDDRFNKRSNEVFTDIVHTILVLSGCKSQRNDIKTGIQTYCFPFFENNICMYKV